MGIYYTKWPIHLCQNIVVLLDTQHLALLVNIWCVFYPFFLNVLLYCVWFYHLHLALQNKPANPVKVKLHEKEVEFLLLSAFNNIMLFKCSIAHLFPFADNGLNYCVQKNRHILFEDTYACMLQLTACISIFFYWSAYLFVNVILNPIICCSFPYNKS